MYNTITANSLANNGTKLVTADATGTFTPFAFSGQANEVLYGNGTWGLLPAPPQTYWTQNVNDIYYNSGKVGIGTTHPLEMLDINGNIRTSGTVYANGGLVVGTFKQGTAIVTTALGVGTLTPTEKVDVIGNIKASGTIYSNFSQMDSLHILNKIKVGNSIYIGDLPQPGVPNNIYASNGDLLIQSEQNMSACPVYNTIINYNNNGKVGIGTIPSIDAGIKLHVKGFTCTGLLCASCGSGTQPAGESTIFRLEDAVTGDITRTAWWDFVASGFNHKLFIKTKSSDGIINAYVMTMAENGKVGIGNTDPTYHLQVESALDNQFQVIGKGMGFGGALLANIYSERNSEGVGNALLKVGTAFNPNTLYVADNGKVGIGTVTPVSKLHIKDGFLTLDGTTEQWTNSHWNVALKTPIGYIWETTNTNNLGRYMGFGMTSTGWYWTMSSQNGTSLQAEYPMSLTLGSSPSNSWLNVCGTIQAKAYIASTGWCDYVFEPEYKLLPLNDLSAYIDSVKHLPDIPPASEIETNGVDLGDMVKKQMLKIEELTLYLIEMKKENDLLKVRITSLEKK